MTKSTTELKQQAIEEEMRSYFDGDYMDSNTVQSQLSALWDAAFEAGRSAAHGESKETDLSKRLRAFASNLGFAHSKIMLEAANEIERYYDGMLAWKATAEAKDRESSSQACSAEQSEPSPESVDGKAINALLWFYRRAKPTYGRLPFAEDAIAALRKRAGREVTENGLQTRMDAESMPGAEQSEREAIDFDDARKFLDSWGCMVYPIPQIIDMAERAALASAPAKEYDETQLAIELARVAHNHVERGEMRHDVGIALLDVVRKFAAPSTEKKE